ncbi:MAG: DoxX family membrane protein [Burkholderiales bacterium]
MSLITMPARVYQFTVLQTGKVAHLFNLAVRLYIANVFLKAGLTKIQSWGTTLQLFENEYAVPILPPELAAYLGTAAELLLPALLVLGLAARPAALALFLFNMVAVISYPDISEAGVKDHVFWGWMIAVIFFYGAGKLSADAWLRHKIDRMPNRP